MVLEELHVQHFALIEEAWIEFAPGVTVLTGETGAGKTALVGALKLLVGERADSSMVRSGSSEAVVEGRFSVDGSDVVAKRRLSADGRSKCALDGSIATVGTLAARLGPLVDLHGQHEHQALLTPARHVGYLDRFGGDTTEAAIAAYRAARESWGGAKAELARLESLLGDAEQRADYLRFVLGEIERVDPQPGEDEEIERGLPALINAEQLAEAAHFVRSGLAGEGAAVDAAAGALEALQRVADLDPRLDALATRVRALVAEGQDIASEARHYAEGVEHDPAVLEERQSRLAELSGLKKKYGPSLDAVLSTRDDARVALESVETGDAAVQAAQERAGHARAALEEAAARLAQVRREAADGFVTALTEAVEGLHLAGARFEVAFEELAFDSWGPDGSERIEFRFAPALGEPARALARIASGGEISRVMLAIKGVLGQADEVPVLVFDEVDAGIGGATGLSVGARLASLAPDHQVLVITHLPQVAVFADHHLVVRKRTEAERTVTVVEPVTGDARVAEIARMLAGSESETSLAHAEELLDQVAALRERKS